MDQEDRQLLRAIAEDLHAMRIFMEKSHKQPNPLREKDRAQMVVLLPAIFGGWKTSSWTLEELWDAPLQGGDALREVLGPNEECRRRELGRLFARAKDHAIGGLQLSRVVRTNSGVIWTVEETAGDAQ